MKYIVLLCDGMSDFPLETLQGQTPMQKANKPNMNLLAHTGEQGLCKTVPDGMKPGSDVANLSALGYNPAECYTGRSPLEAASIGIDMNDRDVALRCNLVTLSDDSGYSRKIMLDYSGGDINTADAGILIRDVAEWAKKRAGAEADFDLYPGVAYRHCLIWRGGKATGYTLTPPHDISGKAVGEYLDETSPVGWLVKLQQDSFEFLSGHPLNRERVRDGKRPANSLWFWGQGTKPALEDFKVHTGLDGAVISAVDLIKGIGRCANMRVCEVAGATGYLDTNFEGKASAALCTLNGSECGASLAESNRSPELKAADFVFIHIEAPDECGHRFEVSGKIKAIEEIDRRTLKPLLDGLTGEFRILIMPDHPTPLSTGTHSSAPVPFLIYDSRNQLTGSGRFDEESAKETGLYFDSGAELMKHFLEI